MARLDDRRPEVLGKVHEEDVERAIAKLKSLGNGFEIHETGAGKVVQSVPTELSKDHTELLAIVEMTEGHTSVEALSAATGWNAGRAKENLNQMLKEGMAWIDAQTATGDPDYWFPLFTSASKESITCTPSS